MTRILFEEVAVWRSERFVCPVCGKRRARRKKFYQTVNPFNVWRASEGGNGLPKTRDRIMSEINAKAKAWTPVCAGCEADMTIRKTKQALSPARGEGGATSG